MESDVVDATERDSSVALASDLFRRCTDCGSIIGVDETAVVAVEMIPMHAFGDPIAGVVAARRSAFHQKCFGSGAPGWVSEPRATV